MLPQTFDAGHARHPNIHDDGVRPLLDQKLQTLLHRIGRVDLITRLQEHPQALARAHLVVDDEDLWEISGRYHCVPPSRS